MATKNLARTVIEGGRRPGNRWDRRESNREARTAARHVSTIALRSDPECVDYAPRRSVYREFDDKLRPAERWLHSQVGRPWDKVRSELFRRFDTRTTAGRHILFCHLLKDVLAYGEALPRYGSRDFRVNAHGILCVERDRRRRFAYHLRPPLPEPEAVLRKWLGVRRVGERGTRLYWFVPTPAGRFRQATLLDEAEAARWRKIPAWFRESFDPTIPLPTPPFFYLR